MKLCKLIKCYYKASILILFLSLLSCRNITKQQSIEEIDTIEIFQPITLPSLNNIYCIPSPQLTNIYLKQIGVYPNKTLPNRVENIERYTTTTKKAFNLGVYAVDIGYLNLYITDENTDRYVLAMSQLADDLGLNSVFTRQSYNDLAQLKTNQDSLARYLSVLLTRADEYLKSNGQQHVSAFVIAGSWIESFYLLCSIYKMNPSNQLLSFIYQHKHILDNIIKIMKNYYKLSPETDAIIDTLIEMAYNFDVLDFHYSYDKPMIYKEGNVLIVNNKCEITGSGPALDSIINMAIEIRNKIIN